MADPGLLINKMGEILTPPRVKLFSGIISRYPELFDTAEKALAGEFGPIDLKSAPIPFNFTDYYTKEMGAPLIRGFFSFRDLITPDELSRIKIWTNRMEHEIGASYPSDVPRPTFRTLSPSGRSVNLDPGYLDKSKMVLATTKDYNHRIYLKDGIYVEVTLQYRTKEGFKPFPWTYPDYQTKPYLDFFNRMREIYVRQAGD